MAYVKLDTKILDSTLWVERECREVFITALLMAVPKEFTEPQRQIEVRSLEETGFVAPAGWYGFVPAAGIGIVRRALVDQEVGLRALEKLGEPDPESRSKKHEGRRMIRVDGGYIVLNFMDHRDHDHTAAIRAQRYRDRKMAQRKVDASRRDITSRGRNVTQAEAEAEADALKKEGGAHTGAARAADQGETLIEQVTAGHAPTPAGAVCQAMRRAGLSSTNPGDPRLLELIRQGATVEEFAGVAADAAAKGKGFAWCLVALQGRRQEAAGIQLAQQPQRVDEAKKTAEMLAAKQLTAEERAASAEARRRVMAQVQGIGK